MKSKWNKYTVQDLINLNMLEAPKDGNHGIKHPKKNEFVSSGIPFIMAKDLKDGFINFKSCSYLSKEKAKDLTKGFCKPGDVLLSHKASIGKTAIVPEDYETIILSPQVTYYRVKKGIDNRYLKYYFDSFFFQNTLQSWSNSGSTRAYLGITGQKQLPVILPSFEEQVKIAEILEVFDQKIQLNNKINDNLEEQLLAFYHELFLDNAKPTWKDGTIADLGNVVGGGTPSKKRDEYYTKHGIAWITPKDLSNNHSKFITHGEIDITELGFSNSSTVCMPSGTVLFSSRAPIGYIAIADGEVTTNQGFKSIVPFNEIGTAFVYCFLKENLTLIENMASGSTFKEISGSTMKVVPVTIPDAETLTVFRDYADILFAQQRNNEAENRQLSSIRDLLLPKLISGDLDISNFNF